MLSRSNSYSTEGNEDSVDDEVLELMDSTHGSVEAEVRDKVRGVRYVGVKYVDASYDNVNSSDLSDREDTVDGLCNIPCG